LEEEKSNEKVLSFWEHLEVLRWTIIRIIIVLTALMTFFFSAKDFLFSKIIFPPLRSDFLIYKAMHWFSVKLNAPSLNPGSFHLQMINYNLSGQFMAHISTAFSIALIFSVPYILFEIWKFIGPALYQRERKNVGLIFLSSSVLFYLGAGVSYFLVFPLTLRFLGTYQVSELVPNQISLESYLSALYILVFSLGIMFELPVLVYFLSRIGILNRKILKAARNYAFVIILIIAAIITPTTDPFTMMVVALPIYLLYELSILVCKK
jgi:sec-independent protein translocase protein TatC